MTTTKSSPHCAPVATGATLSSGNAATVGGTDTDAAETLTGSRVVDLAIGAAALVLLMFFALLPRPPQPGADSVLISSPQSIGGRS